MMNQWNVNLVLEPNWVIFKIANSSSPSVFLIYLRQISQGKTFEARFDVDKNTFLDSFPISIDSSQIRNLIRGAVS